jgi:hypothetical protein
MARSSRALVLALLAMAASAPVSAALFTVTLNNGMTFSSRYRPLDADWDAQKIVLLDEAGNLISLSKSDVDTVESDVDTKGYGHMLDDTTMAFGWAPNDRGDIQPGEGIAGADYGASESEEPVYNVNETPSMPVFYTVPTDSIMPQTVVAPPVQPPTQ